jgi:hypothetical protein
MVRFPEKSLVETARSALMQMRMICNWIAASEPAANRAGLCSGAKPSAVKTPKGCALNLGAPAPTQPTGSLGGSASRLAGGFVGST